MKKFVCTLIALFLMSPFLGWGLTRCVCAIQYGRHCGGHLKRAADANTVELAKEEMETVVNYLNDHNMTKGYTAILWTTPDTDVGFWYKNLSQSLEELRQIQPEASKLEQTNMLMKLRETLVDEGQSVSVTQPSGISIFPYNIAFAAWGWISALLVCVGFVVGAAPFTFWEH